ncbi:ERF family protein [Campylobacter sp. RM12647]|uniref:ERF family protein n=1 Tax=Campylobacter sp. RM12647 TaxID=2735737 RepID=UPI001D258E72|nr:ERF family protein [Campylobacter sp. RM12647]
MSEIIKVLSTIQQKIKAKKDAKNKFAKYEYRTIESILENYKKASEGLETTLTFSEKILCDFDGKIILEATAILQKANESISSNAIVEIDYNHKGMSKEQIWGTASTYAKKRAVSSLLCLDDSEDDPDSLDNDENPNSNSLVDEIKNLAKIKNVAIEQILKCEKLKSLENAKPEQLHKILDNLRS